MSLISHHIVPSVCAHCDLACSVYDPAQARIEAQSIYNICRKYQASKEEDYRIRAVVIKEERAELCKHHLWVLWTDYFTQEHAETYPELHALLWRATKAAGNAKKSVDPAVAQDLIDVIDEVGELFAKTKEGYDYHGVRHNMELQAV